MRVTEGTCGSCGVYVFWSESEGRYLDARTKSPTCSTATPTHIVQED